MTMVTSKFFIEISAWAFTTGSRIIMHPAYMGEDVLRETVEKYDEIELWRVDNWLKEAVIGDFVTVIDSLHNERIIVRVR